MESQVNPQNTVTNMGKLTTKARKKIKTSNFAEPAKRGYPIENKSHAINALARVKQFGSPAEIKQVHAAVDKKYPGLRKKP